MMTNSAIWSVLPRSRNWISPFIEEIAAGNIHGRGNTVILPEKPQAARRTFDLIPSTESSDGAGPLLANSGSE
jgi:hypothetical protein